MTRKEELKYIIKGIKIDLYNQFLELNNDHEIGSLKSIKTCKELLEDLEKSKNEFNLL